MGSIEIALAAVSPPKRLLILAGLLAFVAAAADYAVADPTRVQRATYETELPGAHAGPTKSATAAKRPTSKTGSALPLPPQAAPRDADDSTPRPVRPATSLATGIASLALVLAIFLAAAWALRRGMPQGAGKLPADVVEVLGRTPLAGRQFAYLIRCGNKLLLVSIMQGCVETLTEITEPAEVDRLAGLCRQAHPQSATTSFKQVFQQFSREKSGEVAE